MRLAKLTFCCEILAVLSSAAGQNSGAAAEHEALTSMGINVKAHGARGDGHTDDSAAIQAGIAASNGTCLNFPRGVYNISAPIVITQQDNCLVFDFGARLKYVGRPTSTVLTADGSQYVNGIRVHWTNVSVDGNGAAGTGIRINQASHFDLHRPTVYDVQGTGIVCQFCVIGAIYDPAITSNIAQPMVPENGIELTRGKTISAANIIVNPRLEGLRGFGLRITQAADTLVLGGTSEHNGVGVIIDQLSFGNTIEALECEGNKTDAIVAGTMNTFLHCPMQSQQGIRFTQSARNNRVNGGKAADVMIESGAYDNELDSVLLLKGTVTNQGRGTVMRSVYDVPGDRFIEDVSPRRGETPGAGPLKPNVGAPHLQQ